MPEALVVFGLPRSGTTLLASILHQYLVQKGLVSGINLGEIFNPRPSRPGLTVVSCGAYQHLALSDTGATDTASKITLLKAYPGYLFKVLAGQCTEGIFDFLLPRYTFVVPMRNPWAVIHSYLIADTHDIYNRHPSQPEPNFEPFVAKKETFLKATRHIERFQELMPRMRDFLPIQFGDLIDRPPALVLNLLHLDPIDHFDYIPQTARLQRKTPEELIRNYVEVQDWYHEWKQKQFLK